MRTPWKFILTTLFILNIGTSQASLTTFEFTVDGFANGGSIIGTFTGEDLDGDGYLSSFLFTQDQFVEDAGFSFGDNEVTSVSLTYNGPIDPGNGNEPVTTFTIGNELTDISDELFPGSGFPLDLFFSFNYELNGSGVLGDSLLEGMIIGQADQDFVFGLGQFLPIPPGQDIDALEGNDPRGYILTSRLIAAGFDTDFSGTNCTDGYACGVVHNVFLGDDFVPFVGGYELTSGLAQVSQVSAPAAMPLFSMLMFASLMFALRGKDEYR